MIMMHCGRGCHFQVMHSLGAKMAFFEDDDYALDKPTVKHIQQNIFLRKERLDVGHKSICIKKMSLKRFRAKVILLDCFTVVEIIAIANVCSRYFCRLFLKAFVLIRSKTLQSSPMSLLKSNFATGQKNN